MGQTIPLLAVREYFSVAVRNSSTFERILADSLIPAGAGPDFAVSQDQFNLVVLHTMRSLDDETHGLGAFPLRAGSSTIALHAMCGCPTLGNALTVLERYFELLKSPLRVCLSTNGDTANVHLWIETKAGAPVTIEGYWLGWVHIMSSWFVGAWIPAEGVLRHGWDPLHDPQGGHHPVVPWDARGERTQLTFPTSWLLMPKRIRDTSTPLGDAYRFYRASRIDQVSPALPDDVARTARGGRLPKLTRISAENGVSVSTLSRRLKSRGISFRRLQSDSRLGLGLELLRGTDLSIDEVAERLGYAEARSFRRFLKTVTGLTPQEIRSGETEATGGTDALINSKRMQIVETLNF